MTPRFVPIYWENKSPKNCFYLTLHFFKIFVTPFAETAWFCFFLFSVFCFFLFSVFCFLAEWFGLGGAKKIFSAWNWSLHFTPTVSFVNTTGIRTCCLWVKKLTTDTYHLWAKYFIDNSVRVVYNIQKNELWKMELRRRNYGLSHWGFCTTLHQLGSHIKLQNIFALASFSDSRPTFSCL